MSLINEALKKAQRDRPEMPMAPPPGGPMPPPHQRDVGPKRKHRSFLWGFLLAVLLVGGLSSLLAAYLVIQLTDPQPSSTPQSAPAQTTASIPPAGQETGPDESVEEPGLVLSEEPIDPIAPAAIAETASKEAPDKAEALPIQSRATYPPLSPTPPKPESTLPAPVPETLVEGPSVKAPDLGSPPSAELIERLRNLEVRGLMSGATKVLLFDSSTGKTRVFTVGDPLGDQFGLTIHSISTNSVKFKDYAGQIHTKSF